MFKFLKEKLKGAISRISKKIGEEKPIEETIKEKPIEKEPLEIKKTTGTGEKTEEIKEQVLGKKKGFFSRITERITTTKISREKFENLFSELELILMEN